MGKANIFQQIQVRRPQTNLFDLSHDVKLTCNMGELVPIMCMECIPGEKIKRLSNKALVRMQPLVAPVMHRFDVSFHYFFVPHRLVWPNWEKYVTNNSGQSPLPAFPTVTLNEALYSSGLADYLGLPKPSAGQSATISAIPFAMYQLIWNEFFRDQNLQTAVTTELINGDNSGNLALSVLRNRAWEHDYFTSCLPFAQKGEPVMLPIGEMQDVPVYANRDNATNVQVAYTDLNGSGDVGNQPIFQEETDSTAVEAGELYANTSDLINQATTVTDLRRATKLQEWLELAARAGSRYAEHILGFFGVRTQDYRLQRPEYITGTTTPIMISEVLNTTGTEDLPQGNMAGHGVAVTQPKWGKYRVMEHGYIIGVASVRPKTAYQQGIPKHFLKINDPFETFYSQFQHIGEQAVANEEIFAFTGSAKETFGYIPRYAEYKFENNRVAGDFKTTLDYWHLGRIFDPGAPPALNDDFIQCVPDTRIFAVEDPVADKILIQCYNEIKSIRPMAKYGSPIL